MTVNGGFAIIAAMAAGALGCGAAASPAPPAQPVQFSHQQHVADNQIGCGVCHPYARHSPAAGLAAAATCIGCHKFVAKDKPAIQRLTAELLAGKRTEWTRLHRLPDHVFFSHQRHLFKGVACSACHGDVASMGLDHPVQQLNMGFCMECHRQKQASTDCLACHK